MPTLRAVRGAGGRPTFASQSPMIFTFLLVCLGLSAPVGAAPVTWTFSGFTVAQSPFCSSVDLPCFSTATYAFTGSVQFDPTTSQMLGMTVDVDFGGGRHYVVGAGTIQYGVAAQNGVSGTAVVMQSGHSTLRLAPFAAGFAGPLAAPPACEALPAAYLPFASSCEVSVVRADQQRQVLGSIFQIQQVPEPAVGLCLLTGMAAGLRRFRRGRATRPTPRTTARA